MNISTNLIKQYADVRKQLVELGVISSTIVEGELHVRSSVLVNEEGLKIESRGEGHYPYEISVTVDGIKLFALITEKELAQYPQLQGYMIDDVDLSGSSKDGDDHAA